MHNAQTGCQLNSTSTDLSTPQTLVFLEHDVMYMMGILSIEACVQMIETQRAI